MEDARHLSKYVFPREYGLATVFASAAKAYKYPDFADREDEIKVRVEYALHHLQLLRHGTKKTSSKTPKRVKSALDLLDKIIGRHGTCFLQDVEGHNVSLKCEPSQTRSP